MKLFRRLFRRRRNEVLVVQGTPYDKDLAFPTEFAKTMAKLYGPHPQRKERAMSETIEGELRTIDSEIRRVVARAVRCANERLSDASDKQIEKVLMSSWEWATARQELVAENARLAAENAELRKERDTLKARAEAAEDDFEALDAETESIISTTKIAAALRSASPEPDEKIIRACSAAAIQARDARPGWHMIDIARAVISTYRKLCGEVNSRLGHNLNLGQQLNSPQRVELSGDERVQFAEAMSGSIHPAWWEMNIADASLAAINAILAARSQGEWPHVTDRDSQQFAGQVKVAEKPAEIGSSVEPGNSPKPLESSPPDHVADAGKMVEPPPPEFEGDELGAIAWDKIRMSWAIPLTTPFAQISESWRQPTIAAALAVASRVRQQEQAKLKAAEERIKELEAAIRLYLSQVGVNFNEDRKLAAVLKEKP